MSLGTVINKILGKFNLRISKINKAQKVADNTNLEYEKDKVLLNLGSGNWSYEGWINLDYPSEWYAVAQKNHSIVPYDIRNDNIPYDEESVDAVYCSHVIEHIENNFIQNMFNECNRILKPRGVIRICCPDAEFLYKVSKQDTDYWEWRNKWFNNDLFCSEKIKPRNVDYLVREIATPMLLNYNNSINNKDYLDEFNTYEMYDFFEFLTSNLKFRKECVGDHINYWAFEKAEKMLEIAGFKIVIRSKWNGSVSKFMKNMSKFDVVHPNMSLYIEAIK